MLTSLFSFCLLLVAVFAKGANGPRGPRHKDGSGGEPCNDLALWIDQEQVKMFSGMSLKIDVIANGNVQPYILEPMFEQHLPEIPSEVSYVNFTWMSGMKKYYYHFDRLHSYNEAILHPPVISIKTKGRVPKKAKGRENGLKFSISKFSTIQRYSIKVFFNRWKFSVLLPCSGNISGIATFSIGLLIQTRKGRPVPGTPLRLQLRKECAHRGVYPSMQSMHSQSRLQGPDPECNRKCANHGWCNEEKICQCPEGYMGQHCQTALCYPQCMNGGNCTAPGQCSCPQGFQGHFCEGGICDKKCLNGGKCIQKDTCDCSKGFYGMRCEISKCVIPCLNGGKCKGINVCRCPPGYQGDHCEKVEERRISSRNVCTRHCRHGICGGNNTCHCNPGWYGRLCNQSSSNRKQDQSKLPRR